jgi:type VI secretion system secreted protein Hcp
MAADAYLRLTAKRAGRIKGEARAPDHADDIEVRAWNWSVQATSAIGTVTAVARRSYSALTVHKQVDCATTALMSALASNDEIKEAVLSCRKSGGDPFDFLVIKLAGARITQVAHAVGDDAGETVTLSFNKVTVEYRSQLAGGGAGPTSVFEDTLVEGK